MRKRLGKNGFTLVELVAVVALIGILSSTAVPLYVNVVNESKESVCLTNRRMIDSAWKLLSIDTPLLSRDDADIVRTLSDAEVLPSHVTCPSGGVYSLVDGEVHCSVHNAGTGGTGGTGGSGGTGGGIITPPPPSYEYRDASYTYTVVPNGGTDIKFDFKIYNTTTENIYGWMIEFDSPYQLTTANSAYVLKIGDNRYQIKCTNNNAIIPIGDSRGTIGYGKNNTGNPVLTNQITNVQIRKVYDKINATAHMNIYERWNKGNPYEGFNYKFTITNHSNMPIVSWVLEFTYDGVINNSWIGFQSLGSNRYRFISPERIEKLTNIPANSVSDVFTGGGGKAGSTISSATLNGEPITITCSLPN